MLAARFAPSPTGEDIHIGNLRAAVVNHHYARVNNGLFILRIEDTLNERVVEACKDRILESLIRMDMKPDLVFLQSSCKEKHCMEASCLVDRGVLYEKDGAVWFPAGEGSYTDLNYGEIKDTWDDFVCIRSNGEPSFLFANLMDDLELMKSYDLHVIRGNDHMHNTVKQAGMCAAMGVKSPVYKSLPMILGADGKPLSKRDKAGTVGSLLDMGIVPACLYRYLSDMGNGKAPAHMDLKKMLNMNRAYMTCDIAVEAVPECGPFWKLIKDHVRCTEDILTFRYLWEAPAYKGNFAVYGKLLPLLEEDKPVDAWVEMIGGGRKECYGMLRQALCGSPYSLDLNLVVKSLGKEELMRRLL